MNYLKTYENIYSIYQALSDEESKYIFRQRLLFSLDQNFAHIEKMLKNLFPSKSEKYRYTYFLDFLDDEIDPSHALIIFGAGGYGELMLEYLDEKGYSISAFCDNSADKQGKTFCGLPVISPQNSLLEVDSTVIFVCATLHENAIISQLIEMGVSPAKIIKTTPSNEKKQYFGEPFLQPVSQEIFLHLGCGDGETINQFRDWCSDQYRQIIAFEPDPINYRVCIDKIEKEKIKNIDIINKGAWDKKQILTFESGKGTTSTVSEDGDIKIEVDAIDNLVSSEKITFISMDIEGSELKALQGAKNTILSQRPRLAICVYHKPEDIINIILFIQQLIPEYKLYLRHYTLLECDTVLYAVI